MIAQAFAELFVAGLLETTAGPGGDRRKLYRASADIDMALLSPAQRLVVECLDVFRTFNELLQVAARKKPDAAGALPETSYLSPQDACLLAEACETINEALEYLPPVCTCSI